MSNSAKPIPTVRCFRSMEQCLKSAGDIIAWANVLLIGVIILQVVLRKFFSNGSVMLEELQWHLYAIVIMFGVVHAQLYNSNVRVDLLSVNFSPRARAVIEVVGLTFLVLPFVVIQFMHGLDFVYDSWRIGESSTSPSGLPYRWLIKSVIPISLTFLFLALTIKIANDINFILRGEANGDQ